MKITISITITIIVFSSCRTSKHTTTEQQRIQRTDLSQSQLWQQSIQRDSSHRYWTFSTDSLIYFHPDKGLWAYGGHLYAEEKTLSTLEDNFSAATRDSSSYDDHRRKTDKQVLSEKKLPWFVYLIGVSAILLLGWYFKNFL